MFVIGNNGKGSADFGLIEKNLETMIDLTRKQYIDQLTDLLSEYSNCEKTTEQIKIKAHQIDKDNFSNKEKFDVIMEFAFVQKKKFKNIELGITTTKLPQSDSDKRNGIYYVETRKNGVLVSNEKKYSQIYISN